MKMIELLSLFYFLFLWNFYIVNKKKAKIIDFSLISFFRSLFVYMSRMWIVESSHPEYQESDRSSIEIFKNNKFIFLGSHTKENQFFR